MLKHIPNRRALTCVDALWPLLPQLLQVGCECDVTTWVASFWLVPRASNSRMAALGAFRAFFNTFMRGLPRGFFVEGGHNRTPGRVDNVRLYFLGRKLNKFYCVDSQKDL